MSAEQNRKLKPSVEREEVSQERGGGGDMENFV